MNEHIKELLLPKEVAGKYKVIKNITGREIQKQDNLMSPL